MIWKLAAFTLLTSLCAAQLSAQSTMQVRENSASTVVITDNQPVGGARDLGLAAVPGGFAEVIIWVDNTGASDITFGSFTKSGAHPADFYVYSPGFSNPLPPGDSICFWIRFSGVTPGLRSATIELPHNATGGPVFRINVQCNAYTVQTPSPTLEVTLGSSTGQPITHQQSPVGTSRDFGTVDTSAGPSTAITIFVNNLGPGVLDLAVPQLGGTWKSQYVLSTAGFAVSLASGQSTSFSVSFDPSSVGPKDAYVSIPHTDPTKPATFKVPVFGTGYSSAASMMLRHDIGSQVQIVDGGGRNVGALTTATATRLNFIVQNQGASSLILIGTPTVAVNNPVQCTAVVLVGVGSTTVSPGGSTTFSVDVTPTAAGLFSFEMSIPNNDPLRNPYTVTISGNATAAPTSNGGSKDSQGECSTSSGSGLGMQAIVLACLAALLARRRRRAL
ncbi:MAG: choice-of-anchor D domain-containing protein [Planctomycetes bacterium]|nr:choice-of-anchor D domain-containing protein [Planctomycetota bacterium]